MSATLHLVGGPLDGTVLAHPRAPRTIQFPQQPPLCLLLWLNPDDPLPHCTTTYVRRRRLLGGHVLYDWSPE